MNQKASVACPRCNTDVTGAFCTTCGTAVGKQGCVGCGAELSQGAAFCSSCGTPVGAAVPHGGAEGNPRRVPAWLGPTFVGLLAVVAIMWAGTRTPASPPIAAAPGAVTGAPPDLSQLTPGEQFLRLADRIEGSVQSGDTATVVQFFPMLEAAFANLSDAERDVDARFHLSLLRAQVGHSAGAVAQVDSIVAVAKNHLFADYLRAMIADFQGDAAAGRAARLAFREHFEAEIAQQRPEYFAHRALLDDFLKTTPTP